jgi:uncharacterized protein (TIGR00297 family)
MALLTLNKPGIVAAIALAALLLFFGRGIGWLFVALMLYFLLLAFVVTYFRLAYKEKRGLTKRTRGARNVLANGLGPLLFAALYFAGIASSNNILALSGFLGFFAAVASITADKFSSELGVLDGLPREIFTMKLTKKGRSGAITAFGLAMAVAAAVLVASAVIPFRLYNTGIDFYGLGTVAVSASIIVSGFIGSIMDSMLGYLEEKGVGNKHTSNLLCSIAGGAIEVALVLLLL